MYQWVHTHLTIAFTAACKCKIFHVPFHKWLSICSYPYMHNCFILTEKCINLQYWRSFTNHYFKIVWINFFLFFPNGIGGEGKTTSRDLSLGVLLIIYYPWEVWLKEKHMNLGLILCKLIRISPKACRVEREQHLLRLISTILY